MNIRVLTTFLFASTMATGIALAAPTSAPLSPFTPNTSQVKSKPIVIPPGAGPTNSATTNNNAEPAAAPLNAMGQPIKHGAGAPPRIGMPQPPAPPTFGTKSAASVTPSAPASASTVVRPRRSRLARSYAHRAYSIGPKKGAYASSVFDFRFNGDLFGAIGLLREVQPGISIIRRGDITPIEVDVDLSKATALDVVSSLGEAIGDKASLRYDPERNYVVLTYFTVKEKDSGENPPSEARRWQSGESARPIFTGDGLIQYPYGMTQPVVPCSPLHACDVQLESGEVVNNVILGDSVRWVVSPAKTGDGNTAVQHVIIKPVDNNLNTNLIITTNKRTYYLTLKSSSTKYVSRIGWYYPADMVTKWSGELELRQRQASADAARVISDMPSVTLENLNLEGYRFKGDKDLDWYPLRAFDDGQHVYIQMSSKVKASEAPTLVIMNSDDGAELVNYRVKEGKIAGRTGVYYIVDKLFKRAALISGVGGDQEKVIITREPR